MTDNPDKPETQHGTPPESPQGKTAEVDGGRRRFVQGGAVALGVAAATTAALSPLFKLFDEDNASIPSLAEFMQKYYKELSKDEMDAVLARLEEKVEKERKVEHNEDIDVTIKDYKPMPGVEFAYALNIGRCVGCRRCAHACVDENNQSRSPEIQYIRVLEMKMGEINVETSEHYYGKSQVPQDGHFYMPVQCHQCRRPACTKVCPVKATWQDPDGIVVIDYNWCIGCRYCEAACPYFARRFNFAKPVIPKGKLNKKMGYLSNRPRAKGVMEKCHFCLHRTRQGRYPACVEVCPAGARKFGNILDPESEIRRILKDKRVFVLKQDVLTHPRFYYYFDV